MELAIAAQIASLGGTTEFLRTADEAAVVQAAKSAGQWGCIVIDLSDSPRWSVSLVRNDDQALRKRAVRLNRKRPNVAIETVAGIARGFAMALLDDPASLDAAPGTTDGPGRAAAAGPDGSRDDRKPTPGGASGQAARGTTDGSSPDGASDGSTGDGSAVRGAPIRDQRAGAEDQRSKPDPDTPEPDRKDGRPTAGPTVDGAEELDFSENWARPMDLRFRAAGGYALRVVAAEPRIQHGTMLDVGVVVNRVWHARMSYGYFLPATADHPLAQVAISGHRLAPALGLQALEIERVRVEAALAGVAEFVRPNVAALTPGLTRLTVASRWLFGASIQLRADVQILKFLYFHLGTEVTVLNERLEITVLAPTERVVLELPPVQWLSTAGMLVEL